MSEQSRRFMAWLLLVVALHLVAASKGESENAFCGLEDADHHHTAQASSRAWDEALLPGQSWLLFHNRDPELRDCFDDAACLARFEAIGGLPRERELCTIERVPIEDMPRERFAAEFRDLKPVIIVGASDNARFRELTSRQNLMQRFGDAKVTLSSANTYSHDKIDVPFSDYVTTTVDIPPAVNDSGADLWYHFGDHDLDAWDPLFDSYARPPFMNARAMGALSFGVGASGSGVPYHAHGPAFNEVLWGRKRWFLTPPDARPSFDPDATSLTWLRHVYPHLPPEEWPEECVVGPGEAIYFPTEWFHSTLNLGQTVFIATFV